MTSRERARRTPGRARCTAARPGWLARCRGSGRWRRSALQIAYPLVEGDARDVVTIATVLAFFLASVTHAVVWRGVGWTAGFCWSPSAAVSRSRRSGCAPASRSATTPTPTRSARAVRRAAGRAVGLGDDGLPGAAGRPPARARPLAAALVGAWALATWDLFLDPMMVGDGHWTWSGDFVEIPGIDGIPLTNFLGWLLTAFVMMLLLALLPRSPRRRRPAVHAVRLDLVLLDAGRGRVLRPAVGRAGRRHRDGPGRAAAAVVALGHARLMRALRSAVGIGSCGGGRAHGAHRIQPATAASPTHPTTDLPRAGVGAAAGARRGRAGRGVPAVAARAGRACRTSRSSCSTTARPTAPPTWSARSPATTRGSGCSPASSRPTAGSASRTRATSWRRGARRRARLRRRRRRARTARGRGDGRAAARGRAGPGLAVPAAARRLGRRATRAAAAAVVVADHPAAGDRRVVAARVAGRRERPAARGRRAMYAAQPAGTPRCAARCSTTSPCCAR